MPITRVNCTRIGMVILIVGTVEVTMTVTTNLCILSLNKVHGSHRYTRHKLERGRKSVKQKLYCRCLDTKLSLTITSFQCPLYIELWSVTLSAWTVTFSKHINYASVVPAVWLLLPLYYATAPPIFFACRNRPFVFSPSRPFPLGRPRRLTRTHQNSKRENDTPE